MRSLGRIRLDPWVTRLDDGRHLGDVIPGNRYAQPVVGRSPPAGADKEIAAIRPPQLRALALAEQRKWRLAQRVLSALHKEGHRDRGTLRI